MFSDKFKKNFMKIKILGYLTFILSLRAFALVPVEGILMGESNEDYQQDPLSYVFSDIYDKSRQGENNKVKLYLSTYEGGVSLSESCSHYGSLQFATSWKEKQALRSIAATLQYLGIDTSIKAIAAYAQKMSLDEAQFKNLTTNLVQNYCSKNISVFSIRNIEKSLGHYFKNPELAIIPSVASSPFTTKQLTLITESDRARSNEFDQAIKSFRAFCSWGGDVNDYRMLTPYLNNRFIMAFIFKNMRGVQDQIAPKTFKVETVKSDKTVQVLCDNLICRKVGQTKMNQDFPLSVGSTGLKTDLEKLYCHHYRYLDYQPKKTIPQVAQWIKEEELEGPIFQTNFFISLMTGIPDLFFGAEGYRDIPLVVKSSIDERWERWALNSLAQFSKDLFFEESLKVKILPAVPSQVSEQRFHLDFTVSLGEMDRLVSDNDKIDAQFNLKLSKNYLRFLRNKWDHLSKEVDLEGQAKFKQETAQFIDLQLKQKERYFIQKIWNTSFSELVSEELLNQAIATKVSYFDSYEDEMIEIPVKFSYGVFALNYLRYRSDVKAGRLKLNL